MLNKELMLIGAPEPTLIVSVLSNVSVQFIIESMGIQVNAGQSAQVPIKEITKYVNVDPNKPNYYYMYISEWGGLTVKYSLKNVRYLSSGTFKHWFVIVDEKTDASIEIYNT